LTVVR
jgi:hypothetical protein